MQINVYSICVGLKMILALDISELKKSLIIFLNKLLIFHTELFLIPFLFQFSGYIKGEKNDHLILTIKFILM